jgi:hypothetical protein
MAAKLARQGLRQTDVDGFLQIIVEIELTKFVANAISYFNNLAASSADH